MKHIDIYTDGSCRANDIDKQGGWGAVILLDGGQINLKGREPRTTSNKMELIAAIRALEYVSNIKDYSITIHSDSQYVVKGLTEWSPKWLKSGFYGSKGRKIANIKLLKQLIELSDNLNVKYVWVKGHSKNYYNETAHLLANSLKISDNATQYLENDIDKKEASSV